VSQKAVRTAIDNAIRNAQKRITAQTIRMQKGQLGLGAWQNEMRENIKQIHLYSAAAGKGGWAQLTQSDLGRVGRELQKQYGFLDKFARGLENGTIKNDGRVLPRARLYGSQGRGTFHLAEREEKKAAGFRQERSVLGAAEHCSDCVAEANRGWVPIGSIKPIGQRQCGGNCKCRIVYRDKQAAPPKPKPEPKPAPKPAPKPKPAPAPVVTPPPPPAPPPVPAPKPVFSPSLADLAARQAALREEKFAQIRSESSARTRMLQDKARAAEDSVLHAPKERGWAWDADGNLLLEKQGTSSQVSFDWGEVQKMKNAAMYTHNHPDTGGSFSPADFNFTARLNVQRFRAVAVEDGKRVTYELRRTGEPGKLDMLAFEKAAKRATAPAQLRAELEKLRPGWNTLPRNEQLTLWREALHNLNARFAARDGRFIYTRTIEDL
jgi:hypothetical protein